MLRERIRELIEPALALERIELVDIESLRMKTRWLVRIFIDKEDDQDSRITLDDCQRVSHLVGDILDVNEIPSGPYTLEVSSPGLDRPLTRDKDFIRYKGADVGIKTSEKIEGSRNFRGKLIDYLIEEDAKFVLLDVDGHSVRIPRHSILKAHIDSEKAEIPRSQSRGKRPRNKK